MTVQEKGRWGEQAAAAYLRRKGYRIVARNFRARCGEIDLIAEDKRFLVFVEVKLRQDARFAAAREFVTWSKQQKLMRTAHCWLAEHPSEKQPRFDVVEVYGAEGNVAQICHLEGAFEEG